MSLGQGTQVIDGQRNTFPTWAAFAPQQYGPQTTGVPNVSPTMPPYINALNTTGTNGAEGVGGYGTAGNNAQATQIAANNPHSWKVSPVWWAILALLLGLFMLRSVHWRDTLLEGSESGRLGGAREEARAEA